MRRHGGILLTGATGFLGRYLLRDLLAAEWAPRRRVGPPRQRATSAEERAREVLEFAARTTSERVSRPEPADVYSSAIFVRTETRPQWCGPCDRSRAELWKRSSRGSEPVVPPDARTANRTAPTSVATFRLYECCAAWGIREVHHVSTAFVCGDRTGPILESDTDRGQQFHNDYERSKLVAELAVREVVGSRVTIYRPGR